MTKLLVKISLHTDGSPDVLAQRTVTIDSSDVDEGIRDLEYAAYEFGQDDVWTHMGALDPIVGKRLAEWKAQRERTKQLMRECRTTEADLIAAQTPLA